MAEDFIFPRPPEDITPKAYFSEWLPAQIADFQDMVKEMGSDVTASLSMNVTGDNGGDWSINLDSGDVTITEGLKDDSLVTIRMSDNNFADAITGKVSDTGPGVEAKRHGTYVDNARPFY